ncbi:MAG: hypothetical protein SFU21_16095, partial [Flavihumibacter sp.]|nr:hypothetical protein [Flavihumibacter sp.]
MNLTYLLGAGASANALPLIMNMNERMQKFVDHLDKFNLLDENKLQQLSQLLDKIKGHYTSDTYAKKLHLMKEDDSLLNAFMAAYFSYEQMQKDLKSAFYSNNHLSQLRTEDVAIYEKIGKQIDYRYDAFLATLLIRETDGSLVLPANINIISWNYDLQFELAYLNFMKSRSLTDAQRKLKISLSVKTQKEKANGWRNLHSNKIVKLNGSASFFKKGNEVDVLNLDTSLEYENFQFNQMTAQKLLDMMICKKDEYDTNIKFSWKNDIDTRTVRNDAKQILSKTDILVVIGYSFPYFNREVDRDIFSNADDKI